VLEAGKIVIMLGSSAEDIRLTGDFEIKGSNTMPLQERVFFCLVDIE
jgi:hypothetical protein